MKKATIIVVAIALWIGISSAGDSTTGKDAPKVLVLGSLSKVYNRCDSTIRSMFPRRADARTATISTARCR